MPVNSAISQRRWTQLILGLIIMMTISSPQYIWTLFTKPFMAVTGSTLAQVQITFSLLIVLQTFFSPAQGWLIERFGPKLLIGLGTVMSGLGWVLAAKATSLTTLYLTYGLFCGIGTGIVYVGIVGLMVRWFPDRRGFAAGVVAAGYGAGGALTTFPIDSMMKSAGTPQTLVMFGCILGAIGFIAALFLRAPSVEDTAQLPHPVVTATSGIDRTPAEMLKTPLFWLLFVMMTMMSTGGLMVTSQFASFAREFGVADVVVFGLAAALPFALTFDRITNGLTRPFFGWVSDRIGRENTMGLAFGLEACAVLLLLYFRQDAAAFVLLSGVVFFGWGEIFSLFPSTLTDSFGTKNATTNYGFLYMAQGVGALLGGPVAAALRESTGSWLPVFGIAIAFDVIVALLALFVLKPMRAGYASRSHASLVGVPAE